MHALTKTPTNGGRHAAHAISEKRRRAGNTASEQKAMAKQKAPSGRRHGETKGAELATPRRNADIDYDIDYNFDYDIDYHIDYNVEYDINYDID